MLAALLALGAAQLSYALPGLAKSEAAKVGKVRCAHVTAQAFRDFAERTYRLPAWERGAPPEHVIEAQRHKLRCARSSSHRKAMKRSWREAKRDFYGHRSYMLEDPWERAWRELSAADQAWAISTGECESGNNPTTDTGNGFEGAHQWVRSTWYAAGGSGSPTEASWYEQAVRAVRWRNIAGASQWPVCGV